MSEIAAEHCGIGEIRYKAFPDGGLIHSPGGSAAKIFPELAVTENLYAEFANNSI